MGLIHCGAAQQHGPGMQESVTKMPPFCTSGSLISMSWVPRWALGSAACRAAMARREPAMVDVHGAVWTGRDEYELVPSAKRYELYEMSYAAKVLPQLHPCLMASAACVWCLLRSSLVSALAPHGALCSPQCYFCMSVPCEACCWIAVCYFIAVLVCWHDMLGVANRASTTSCSWQYLQCRPETVASILDWHGLQSPEQTLASAASSCLAKHKLWSGHTIHNFTR